MSNVRIDAQLSPAEVARVRGMLKVVDPKLKAALARDLRRRLTPIANNIVGDFPAQSPLSGMATRWGGVTAKVSASAKPGPGRALALFKVSANPASFARLLSITERAGSRSSGITPQGEAMIRGLERPDRFPLDGKGGRFLFKSFRRHLPRAVEIARESIDRFVDKLNRS